MNSETNESLLPQIFENNLELDLSSSKISLKEFEISTGKSISDLGAAITDRLCSMPVVRARTIWSALDEASKNELTYHDVGAFNLDLIEKLDIRGSELHAAFISNLAKQMYELDNAPLSTPQYASAFFTIQAELLSTCKQLYSSRPDGKGRLMEFLNSFEIEFLASVFRHEIARYYIDEQGVQWDFDIVESETGNEHTDSQGSKNYELLEETEEAEEFDEGEYEQNELKEFNKIFLRGYNVPAVLEFTYWMQNFAPEIYLTIHNVLMFFSKEQGTNIWERTNAPEPETVEDEEQYKEELERSSSRGNQFSAPNPYGLVSSDAEREERRLIRIFNITHPLKNDFQKIYRQDFDLQGKSVAKILSESGKDTSKIQTFEQLRKAVWDVLGFTSLMQWVNRQDDPRLLLESSGKKTLFEEMNVLGSGAFGEWAIIDDSLERSKALVFKLYGWFAW